MKRLMCVVFAITFMLAGLEQSFAQVQGQWATTGTMQSPRELNVQVRLGNGAVLSAGGLDNNNNLLASAELYSPATGAWSLTASMAEARELFPAVVLTNGKVLVVGGLGIGNTVLSAAELYDPTAGTWSSAGSLSVARLGHTATLLSNGTVLVTGGCTTYSCSADTAVSEIYNPATNSWSTTGSLNTARFYHTAVLLQTGKVLVIDGTTGAATTSCELYDPSKGTWSNAASTNAARYHHASTLLPDGKVLLTGGTTSRYPIGSAELYDPTANTWTLTGNLLTPTYAHTATVLSDGDVLVAGGEGKAISCGKDCTSYIPTSKTEIYNEAAGKFTAATGMNAARAYENSTLLASGRVLTAGGQGVTSVCCIVLNSAEFYTPLTLTFSATSLNFGALEIGLTSAPQMVTVTNVSSHSATFTSIAATGDFSQTNTCPGTLNAGQNCTITVTFKPATPGIRNGSVTLKDNCPGSPVQTIALTGGAAPNAMTLYPYTLTFPGTVAGTSSQPINTTLYNDGTAAVNIKSIAISPNNGTFTQTNNCPSTMAPNTSCQIQVVFTPPDTGQYSATLSVTDSDKSSPQTAALSGTGLD